MPSKEVRRWWVVPWTSIWVDELADASLFYRIDELDQLSVDLFHEQVIHHWWALSEQLIVGRAPRLETGNQQ